MTKKFFIKTSTFAFISLFALQNIFFVSCSNSVVQTESEEGAIKYAASRLENQTEWTSSIDGDILFQDVKSPEDLDRSVKISTNNVYLLSSEKDYENIFPYIQDFASLNISAYDANSLSFIQDFCNAFIKNLQTDSFFQENHIYSIVVFKYQLEKILPEDYKFTKYILGEPFFFEEYIECPVRFFYDSEIQKNEILKQKEFHSEQNSENAENSEKQNQSTKNSQNNQPDSANPENSEKNSNFTGEYKKNNLDVFIYLKKFDNNYKIDQISFM